MTYLQEWNFSIPNYQIESDKCVAFLLIIDIKPIFTDLICKNLLVLLQYVQHQDRPIST